MYSFMFLKGPPLSVCNTTLFAHWFLTFPDDIVLICCKVNLTRMLYCFANCNSLSILPNLTWLYCPAFSSSISRKGELIQILILLPPFIEKFLKYDSIVERAL